MGYCSAKMPHASIIANMPTSGQVFFSTTLRLFFVIDLVIYSFWMFKYIFYLKFFSYLPGLKVLWI